MSTMTVQYDDLGLELAVHVLARLQKRGDDMTPIMKAFGEYLVTSVDERFDRQQAPSGEPWKPVSPAHWKRKRIKKILTESSNLRSRIVYRASARHVEVGTNVIYSAIHQDGGVIERYAYSRMLHFKVDKKTGQSRFASKQKANFAQPATWGDHKIAMPARPYLGLSQADRAELVAIVNDEIRRTVSRGR